MAENLPFQSFIHRISFSVETPPLGHPSFGAAGSGFVREGCKPFRIRAAPYVPPCVLEHILSLKSCFAGYRRRQARRKRRDWANRPIPRPPDCRLENPFGRMQCIGLPHHSPCALIHGTAVFGNPQPFARPAIAACAAMAGRGGGILQVAATFPNNSTAQIQALRLVALSLALSHRERGRVGC
ncbi:hypothetical protein ACVH68_10970, partial [Neisseria gonorrhoeae]